MSAESAQHATVSESSAEAETIDMRHTLSSVTEKISSLVLKRPTPWWWLAGFGVAAILLGLLAVSAGYLLWAGVGIWGVNVPVSWGIAITNFVWWIGIGHAGTLISASLILIKQSWRSSISRFAEAMTVFAVACAGLFPLLHMGRPYYFYWLVPYPNTIGVGPQFCSALVWDVFAITVYLVVSVLFWYIGMLPDLATLRDRARNRWVGIAYAALSLGWRGDATHWRRYEVVYGLLAGLGTALVVSVHSVVALDFSVTAVRGWHSTIFPPYFVAGAMLSGFAMVLVLGIPLRALYGLRDLIKDRHLQNLAKLLLTTSLIVGYSYLVEFFIDWFSGHREGWYAALAELRGPHVLLHWMILICNVVVPLPLFLHRVRISPPVLWLIGVVVLFGMWLERFLIVIASLERDYLPSAWGPYRPTIWDWSLLAGTFGLFFVLFFVFLRVLPIVSVFETRQVLNEVGG
jgi:molybdopterin-containing oxidoreductase family membrane subunit